MLPVKISENLREDMFDQACFGQYGQFQAEVLGDIETDMLFREVCRNGGKSKFLLLISAENIALYNQNKYNL